MANYIRDELLAKYGFRVRVTWKLRADTPQRLKMAQGNFPRKPFKEGSRERPSPARGSCIKRETLSNFQGNLWTPDTREWTEHQIQQDHKGYNP